MKRLLSLVVAVGGVLLLSACAVTTDPLQKDELAKRAALDRAEMYKGQEPVKAPVTLEEAMARAIKYNLDHRLKLMEDALTLKQSDLLVFDMLPKVVAAAGYDQRNNDNASTSVNEFTRQVSLQPSTSSDKGHYNIDLTMTWNLLDFGMSYFQAKQQADRVHIMNERRRKVVHTIIQQVRQAYWLALGAQQLEGRFDPLLKEVNAALEDVNSIEQEKLRPPLETLTYKKTLLEIIKQLEVFRDELAQAKPRLASLMNLPLDQSFTLVADYRLDTMELKGKLDQMETQALLMRPELLEADYNDRISVYETRKAILRMLPGLEVTVGDHFDSNGYLVSKKWVEGGGRVTWNLINLISGPSQYKIAKTQQEISQGQRLALSMAVLTQVHVAYQDFQSRKRQYELAQQLQDVDDKIYKQTMNQAKSGAESRLNEIRSATSAMMAEYRSYQNYAALQNACGQMVATVGIDPLPDTVDSVDVKPLSLAIAARLNAPDAICSSLPSAAPGVTLLSSPEKIAKGEAGKLAWRAQNVKSCSIEPGLGEVQLSGEREVRPTESTTYTLSCSGPGGSAASSAVLAVVSQAPVAAAVQPQAEASAQPRADASAVEQFCRPAVLSVQFDSRKWYVKPEYHAELGKLAQFLKQFPKATGEIGGHTDATGSETMNQKLSLDRAESIRTYLAENFSIDPGRITVKGYGSAKPVADNATVAGKQKNRRIEVNFTCP